MMSKSIPSTNGTDTSLLSKFYVLGTFEGTGDATENKIEIPSLIQLSLC